MNKSKITPHLAFSTKAISLFILLFAVLVSVRAQVTYTSNPALNTYTSCNTPSYTLSCGFYHGNTIQMKYEGVSNNKFVFRIKKCNGSFSANGVGYLTEGAICSTNLASSNFTSGANSVVIEVPIPSNFTSGSKKYYGKIVSSTGDKFHALYVTITATCPPDGYEGPNNNNTYSTANQTMFSSTLNCNSVSLTRYATIHEGGDVDFYKVSYSAAGEAQVSLSNLPNNYDLELVSSNGNNVLEFSDNSGTASENVARSFSTPPSGSKHFFIKVYGNNGASNYSCDNYTLDLNWIPAGPNAPNLMAPSDQSTFSVPPSSITYHWSKNGNYNTATYEIKVRDLTTNTNILNYFNVGNSNSYSHSFNYISGHSYQWTVRAKDNCGNIKEGGFWSFDVQAATGYDLSLSNLQSFGTANMTVGQSYTYSTIIQNQGNANWSGSLYLVVNNSTPIDLGSFAINQGSTKNISYNFVPTTNHVGNNVPVKIVYQTGGNGSSTLVPEGSFANPIYVNIQDVTGACPDTYEPNNSVTSANVGLFPSLGNTNQTGGFGNANIHVDGDVDYYKVNYTETGHFDATISNLPDDYALELTDGNDVTFESSQSPGNGDETVSHDFVGGGSFYLKVYGAGNVHSSCTNYNLSINWIPNNPTACPDSYEDNDSKANADLTAFPTTLSSTGYSHNITDPNIHENGDVDYYKVNYNTDGTVTVNLTDLPKNYDLEILDENMNLASSNNLGTTPEDVSHVFTGVGYFYIKVYKFGGNDSSCSPYKLSLSWVVNTSGPCSNFTDLPSSDAEAFNAASCLCNLGYITPQAGNTVHPNDNIFRADLAKLVFYTIYDGDAAAYSDPFPVPFVDLQQSNLPYYKYAKALSYLEYGDGISPFDRDFVNFRPYDGISKKYALKVILEAFNIVPDNSGPSPFPTEIQPNDDAYGYVKKAYDKGYITSGGVHDLIKRRDVFIILHRIIDECDGSCSQSCNRPTINDSDFFLPGNLTPQNLNRGVAMDEGFFNYSSPTGYYIPGINLSLTFNHSYSSSLVELPKSYTQYKVGSNPNVTTIPLRPLGVGWTHTYNSYLMKVEGWNSNGYQTNDRIMIFWSGGNLHFYNSSTNSYDSDGVFDELTEISSTEIQIKKKSQMVFTFKRLASQVTAPYYLTEIIDRNNNKISIVYEAANNGHRIKEVIGDAGRKLKFYYKSGTNYLERVKDLSGNRNLYFSVNENTQNLDSYTNPRSKLTTYNYSNPSRHLLTTIQMPRGNIITNQYGLHNKLDWSELASGTGETIKNTYTQQYNFNSTNNFLHTTSMDNVGTLTNTDYNENGYAKKMKINSAEIIYDFGNSQLPSFPTHIDYEGFSSNITYDSKGNMKKLTLPQGVVHEYGYNALNDIIWYKDPMGNTTHFYYSGVNLDYITDNMGFKTDLDINTKGQILEMKNPENIIQTFAYDNYGNKTDVYAPIGIHSHYDFDNIGRMILSKNPLNQSADYIYDPHNQIKKIIQHSGNGNIITEYEYDDNDNLIWIKNAKGYKTTMTYDNRDFVKTSNFGNDTKTYTYRDDGLLATYKKPDGHVFNYDYDPLGRIVSDGKTTFTYWGDENLIKTITKDNNTLSFYYDDLDRLDYYIDYYGKTVAYEYDLNSNVTKITYPDGFYVRYIYDANNRLHYVKWDNDTKVVTYTYFKDGRLKKAINPNGTFTDYTYDAAGRTTGLSNKKAGSVVLSEYSFNLDQLGNHVGEDVTEPFNVPTLPDINLTNTYNVENEITNSGFSFNKNGNRTTKPSSTSAWDVYDMMVSKDNAIYEYDGMGLRRKVIKDGNVTKYIWDAQGMGNILMDMDDNGNGLHYYIYGLGLIARKTVSNNTTHYYHYDFRGSTVAMTDASANITHQYKYTPFGAITDMIEADANPFTFVGKYGVMNEGDSTYFMRARYMDALTGRFLSEDPVWTTNLYPYANNNPISLYDPDGNWFGFIDRAVSNGEKQRAEFDRLIEGKDSDPTKYIEAVKDAYSSAGDASLKVAKYIPGSSLNPIPTNKVSLFTKILTTAGSFLIEFFN